MKKLQILTTTAVIGLASAAIPALAQEANTDVDTTTSVNEPALVEKPTIEKSSDVKPILDAQKQVVAQTKEQLTDAQTKANEANKQVSDAQTEVDDATKAVKHAEEIASKATPANIEANKADQKANLADQEANATETATTDAKIATQTETVNNAKTDVANAEQSLKDANADVSAKEAQVQSAKDAISGTGLAQAEDKLDEAKAQTKSAENNVTSAETALTDAKKADKKRQEAINNAQSDVDAKTTLVNETKDNLASATQKANDATSTLTQAEDKLDKATKALDSVDIVKIPDLTQFKEDKASGDSDFMTDSGAKAIEDTEVSIGKNAKSQHVDIDNLTQAQKEEISHLYVQGLKQIREQLSTSSNSNVTKEAIESASKRARAYEKRGQNPLVHGHISLADGPTAENLVRLGSKSDVQNMYDLKKATIQALMTSSFADAPSKWGHLRNNLVFGNNVGIDVANINGDYWLVFAFDKKGTVVTNPTNAEAIQKAYEDAKAEKTKAQTASEKANDALTQASTDYANALKLKTSAEKTLADATATSIQTAVVENNLRLAKLALENAQKRQAEAQKAVDNFSADLASKKQALNDAKSALESAKRVQEQKVQALTDAKTALKTQESKLEALKAQKAKLVEEKNRLVEEAKALAEVLKGYVEAPINLAKAQTTLAEKQDALKNAEAKAKSAKNLVEAITTTLKTEQTKLDEIQSKFDKFQDLEEKAKDNVIATLPDGTIVAIPNGAPTAEELPEFDINSLNRALDDNKAVTIDDKGNVTVNGQAYTSQQQASSKPIYSRVERAKTLPETGEQSNIALIALGAILGAFGIATLRKKR